MVTWTQQHRDRRGARSDRPVRRSFTPAQKLEHLAAYETACEHNQGGAYLRQEGLYSSQITEWRKLRDCGVLAGKKPGERVGRPSPEQAEIARLRRDLDRAEHRLATTETALVIMGKAHAYAGNRCQVAVSSSFLRILT